MRLALFEQLGGIIGALEITRFVGALELRILLATHRNEEIGATGWALLPNGLLPHPEVARLFGAIVAAAVEQLAPAGTTLDDLTFAVFFRTTHADFFLLDELALGIAAASRELTETPVFDRQSLIGHSD